MKESIRIQIQDIDNMLTAKRNANESSMNFETCKNVTSFVDETVIDTENIYNELKFDNPNGGAWKQGWNIEIDESRFAAEKLKVFVVPHSHNDPGWTKTFEQYLNEQTRNILNNMLQYLGQKPRMSFIWAETSFFAAWWETLNNIDREKVRTLINSGQLEFVNGGWVMNDEANTHYSAIITQMIEGHQWLKNNLNYKPRNSWAIDPFGM
ncbi:alpha-mannosidase 2-like protein, partial [Leptotrombidium deliense]